MSQQLINHNADLKRLRDEGYDIEVRSGHLLLKSIPYVDSKRAVRFGTLVCPLDLAGDVTVKPTTHVCYFAGEHPCRRDGSKIAQFEHSSGRQDLGKGVIIDHSFSANPKNDGGYQDFHDKMLHYAAVISAPAIAIDPTVTAQSCLVVESDDEQSVFNYADTASSRCGIGAITAKLRDKRIAIVGVGGTGSYVLDLLAKTPVAEIHLFDGDVFSNHNAFRCPGAPSLDELRQRPLKVDYLRSLYSKMHRKVIGHDVFLDEETVEQVRGMDFVFLCLDRGGNKRILVNRLVEWGTPFIDVGLGVDVLDDSLRGKLRVTMSTAEKRDHFSKRVPFSDGGVDHDYARNIQIADLNALNAALAVIKWKKFCGFYLDQEKEHCSMYTIDGNSLINEDQA